MAKYRDEGVKLKRSSTSIAMVALLITTLTAAAGLAQNKTPHSRAEAEQLFHSAVNQLPIHVAKEIPVNFPIPSYPNNVVQSNFANSKKGHPTAAASIITKDQPQQVFQWYQDTCTKNAWTVKTPTPQAMSMMTKGLQFYLLTAKKENQQIQVVCTAYKKTSGTLVSISWSKSK